MSVRLDSMPLRLSTSAPRIPLSSPASMIQCPRMLSMTRSGVSVERHVIREPLILDGERLYGGRLLGPLGRALENEHLVEFASRLPHAAHRRRHPQIAPIARV